MEHVFGLPATPQTAFDPTFYLSEENAILATEPRLFLSPSLFAMAAFEQPWTGDTLWNPNSKGLAGLALPLHVYDTR